jgi:hypothetical protein
MYIDVCYGSSFVEQPDNLLEIIEGMRGSPSVESPGELCKVRDFEERLTEKVSSLRRIDSVFPDNDAKMLSHNLYIPKIQRKVDGKLA